MAHIVSDNEKCVGCLACVVSCMDHHFAADDKNAVISVSDNGPGIPDEMKSRVFEMFFTGDSGVGDSRRSLGLGLPLCRSILEAHGSSLELRDNEPSGCVFSFKLPLSEVHLNE